MVPQDLVLNTICRLSPQVFDELKHLLLLGYLSFSILDEEKVTADILAEKACDFFTMAELRTGKSFERLLASYLNDLDSIVGGRIAKTPPAQKGDKEPPKVPRARKYYEKVLLIKNQKQSLSIEQLIDYTRVMLTLYSAALGKEGEPIEDFNFSSSCIEPEVLLMTMSKEETTSLLPPTKKKRFNLSDPYGTDTFTFFISILMIYTILDQRLEEEDGLGNGDEFLNEDMEPDLDGSEDLEDLEDMDDLEGSDDLEDMDDLEGSDDPDLYPNQEPDQWKEPKDSREPVQTEEQNGEEPRQALDTEPEALPLPSPEEPEPVQGCEADEVTSTALEPLLQAESEFPEAETAWDQKDEDMSSASQTNRDISNTMAEAEQKEKEEKGGKGHDESPDHSKHEGID